MANDTNISGIIENEIPKKQTLWSNVATLAAGRLPLNPQPPALLHCALHHCTDSRVF